MKRAFALFLTLLGSAFLAGTLALSAPARRVPLLVAVPLLVLLAAQLLRDLRADGVAPSRTGDTRALLWTGALPLAVALVGMVAGPALYTAVWLRAGGRERWAVCVAGAVVIGLALYGVIGRLLGLTIPTGLIGWALLR